MKGFLLYAPFMVFAAVLQVIILPINFGLLFLIYIKEKLATQSMLVLIIFSTFFLDLVSGLPLGVNLIAYSLIFLLLEAVKSNFVFNRKQFFVLSLLSIPLWEVLLRILVNLSLI